MKIILFTLLIAFTYSIVFAQHEPSAERGDPKFRAKGQMEGNRIRASIFNHGQTGRYGGEFPISEQTPYEWPKNTGKVYLALTGLFVGAQVTDEAGESQKVIDVMNYRQSPEGKSWNIEPVPGYFNNTLAEQEIATSTKPETWPPNWPDKEVDEVDPGWPGSWNGYFGKNRFSADMEMFYRASDDRYDRYSNYYPDSTDRTRKGLGILLDVRVMAWSQVLVQDVIFNIHNLINDGTQDLEKVGVTIWFADFVGGDGDSQDDISEFDLLEDILWARDSDHRAPNFGTDPVGIVAVSFLETPGNALDRIDNDGDSPENTKKVTEDLLVGEIADNLIDDNGNGLIDENKTHIPFGVQVGVTYADRIDQNGNGEENSPVVTAEMIADAAADSWQRWPINPSSSKDVHLLMVMDSDLGFAYKDYIDNNDNGEEDSPVVTAEMVADASSDTLYYRYKVPGTNITLYDVKNEDIGKAYSDGIDNDGDGAIDEDIDEGIDEMIDEARDDGIDNDGDWNPLTDDLGLDGVANTGDFGEGDGVPTTGAGKGLPGEPNVDVTDVSETDQIGITNAQKTSAGGLNINSDATMWFDFMRPGNFFEPFPVIQGEYDLFVSSSFFPLRSGQVEPMSIAVMLANAQVPDPDGELRKAEILRKRVRAQETYDNDYQFANAPLSPTLSAVAGDKKVTLYWDDVAETSFDNYIDGIGGDGNDFEGYRIYRSTDPAFQDAESITSGYGSPQFKTPIAIFDYDNGINGFDPIGIDGVKYYIGDDTGLQHSFIDSTVLNGYTYYYVLVSFDRGYPEGDIIPSESPYSITIRGDGTVRTSQNVAVVTPEAPVAGYVPADLSSIELVKGTSTGKITYEIVDEFEIKDGHEYYITFEDTLKKANGNESDTLTTKNFTLIDSTAGEILIDKSPYLSSDLEQPITDGFRLSFFNEERVALDKATSGWNDKEKPDSLRLPEFTFEKFVAGTISGEARPNDYTIIFDDEVGFGTSVDFSVGANNFAAKDVNFKVYNKSEERFIDFGFIELNTDGGEGKLSVKGANRDRIVFLEPNADSIIVKTWWFYFPSAAETQPGYRIPAAGDTAKILLRKPFLSSDIFRFVASESKVDNSLAREDLDNIKVVPNPYVATARWEPKNPFSNGRGPRDLHFTHLPKQCTIRIFTVSGELVKTIEHNSELNDGTAEWDMLTRDNLSVSYGVYVYHIDAPGIGEKIGKFAIIK
ncbi:MAG: hypothetical protein K9J16_11460 [Melioribacteraceae bacterium]|nr:hypothetical protein [Melioribacteraceae bacterium]MCF8356593.1 hypothetical protein [Melioribacteraceae bacterium]MCF8395187.1 hypothetical protein [Melioribacteraceae bacterium]MCF8420031.1 hypothetical protein [Melioribacteraceae bacterium]